MEDQPEPTSHGWAAVSGQPIPAEVTRVQGCDCGGLNMHRTDCAVWRLDHEQVVANTEAARARLADHMATLNAGVTARADQFMAQAHEDRGRHDEQSLIIGSLLTGETHLFGKRVELAWPDGLPSSMTEEDLKALGKHLLDRARGR